MRRWFSNTWANFRMMLTPINVNGALLCVILAAFVYIAYDSFHVQKELARTQENLQNLSAQAAEEAVSNTRALCSLRIERVNDVEDTEAFLKDHPEQVIRLGDVAISRTQFLNDLADAQEIIRATGHLDCGV